MKRTRVCSSIMFVLAAVFAIAAVWTQVIPQYQASGEIRIRPIIPRLVFNTDENGPIQFYDSFVNTQVNIMQSTTVLQRVMDVPEVQQTEWYANRPKTLLQRLKKTPQVPWNA